MGLYLIALVEPNPTAWGRLREKWPDHHYILNERMAFAVPTGIATAETVRDAVGMEAGTNDLPSGIVCALSDSEYSGVLPSKAVNWLKSAEPEKFS